MHICGSNVPDIWVLRVMLASSHCTQPTILSFVMQLSDIFLLLNYDEEDPIVLRMVSIQYAVDVLAN